MFKKLFRAIKSWFVKKEKPIIYTPEIPPTVESPGVINYRKPNWGQIYSMMSIDDDAKETTTRAAVTIKANKERYEKVAKWVNPNMPYWFIGILHYRESSLNFAGVLHNGQKIIGTGKKTTWVPKGRGPFISWEDAAIDALRIKGYQNHQDWSVGACLEKAERYNGLGYRSRIGNHGKIELSPYIAAYTNLHDENSKYWSDGKYKKTAPEKQLGVASIMLALGVEPDA